MSKWRDCPVENESPDPCPKCGATVGGNDPVNGVCQAGATWDRATAAERERCAKTVEALTDNYRRDFCAVGVLSAAAAAIRNSR